MITLDRTRPFNFIYGTDTGGAVYTQDNRSFNGAGEHLSHLDVASAPAPAPAPAPARAAPKPPAQPTPQAKPAQPAAPPMRNPLIIGKPGPDDIPRAIPLQPEDKIDLKAWRRGEFQKPWFEIQAAVQAQYSEKPNNKEHAYKIIDAEGPK